MSGIYSMSTGTRGRRPLVGGVQMSSTTTGGTGGPVGPPLSAMPTMYQQPMQQKPRKLSVSELMGQKARGGPQNSLITDPRTGQRLTNEQAAANGPYTIATGGGGVGRGRGYGGGGDDGRRIGSAAGALGSGGIPTSQRGRFERIIMNGGDIASAEEAAMTPAWDVPRPDTFQPNPRYGNMGRPPVRGFANGTRDSGPKGQIAEVGEKGREYVWLPPHSAVLPNGIRLPSEIVNTAFDEVDEPKDGIRTDAQGNDWRYDAKTGRGVPLNPYLGNTNAPSPRDSFTASPTARFNDLSMRLSALRQEGMAEGRAAVARVQAEQAAEQARRDAFLATGKPVAEAEGGGKVYQTPYGPAIVGGNRPKSFTVENFEGGQVTSPDLRAVDRESAADAAERRVRDGSAATGDSLAGYRARPNAMPTAMDEVVGVAQVPEPSPAATAAATGAIAGDPDNPTEARTNAFRWTSSPLVRARLGRAMLERAEQERLNAMPYAPPLRSRFSNFVDATNEGIGTVASTLGDVGQAVADAPQNAWDYLFTPGGTESERRNRPKPRK